MSRASRRTPYDHSRESPLYPLAAADGKPQRAHRGHELLRCVPRCREASARAGRARPRARIASAHRRWSRELEWRSGERVPGLRCSRG